jgi:hypothetical protein
MDRAITPYALLLTLLSLFSAAYLVPPQRLQKVTVQCEFDSEAYQVNKQTARKQLTNVSWYDIAGREAERWDIEDNNGSPRYIRNVFTYDRAGRRTAHLEHTSSTLAMGQNFAVSRTRGGIKVLPEITDRLTKVTVWDRDSAGNILEVRTTDGEGLLQQKISFTYDKKGRQVSYSNVKGDGIMLCESRSTYSKDGRIQEQIFNRCSMNSVQKVISQTDALGRVLTEEQYSKGERTSPVITSRSVSAYSGDTRTLEWTLANDRGEPTSRLVIVDRGDDEISRKEFTRTAASEHVECRPSDPMCGWTLSSEEFRDYTYSQHGELVREIARYRKASDKMFRYSYVIERETIYLR